MSTKTRHPASIAADAAHQRQMTLHDLYSRGFFIDNMSESCGHGWWSGMYRFLTADANHIGEPQDTVQKAEDDLIQYAQQLRSIGELPEAGKVYRHA